MTTPERQRFLLICADFPPIPGGVATFSVGLARSLQDAGHEVTVLCSVRRDPEHRDAGLHVVRTPAVLNRRLLKILPLTVVGFVMCLLRRPRWMVAMTWGHEGIVALALNRLLKIDYVLAAHGTEVLKGQAWRARTRVMRQVFRRATRVITNSSFTQQIVVGLDIPRERITVLPPVVDLGPGAGALAIQEVVAARGLAGKRVLLTVGRLYPRKGHADVIRALAFLKDRYPDLIYVVAGTGGPLHAPVELAALARECGVANRLHLLGRVSDAELDALYRLCEIFVLPARQDGLDVEGFGIAFVEAGLRERAVIAGRSGAVEESVVDGETGLLVEPGNVAELVETLARLLDDPSLRNRLGRQGLERARALFSPASQSERIRTLIGELGRSQPGASP